MEGVDFDTYIANAPSSSVTDGIGSAGVYGANADQLAGYNTMFYFIGNSTNGFSNGVLAGDKGDEIGGQIAATVVPTAAGRGFFAQSYVAFGGCLAINTFDHISALPSALATHEFLSSTGTSGVDLCSLKGVNSQETRKMALMK